jgi:hypothetical protein
MIDKDNLENYNEYFISYFGRSAEYYIDRLKWYFNGSKTSFNIYAFFMGGFWLLFRKMYRQFFLILLFLFLYGIILEILYLTGVINYIIYSDIGKANYLILPAITGCFSNKWYVKKSIKSVQNAVATFNDPINAHEYLNRKGGTSIVGPIVLLISSIVFFLISTIQK